MQQSTEMELFRELERLLQQYQIETRFVETEGRANLLVRLDELGQRRGEALLEIWEEHVLAGEEQMPVCLLEFCTTLAADMDEHSLLPMARALWELSMHCSVGAFHVYEDHCRLYHRYTAVLPEGRDAIPLARAALNLVVENVNDLYDQAMDIADGNGHDAG